MDVQELESLSNDMCGLFISNERSILNWDPKTGKIVTLEQPLKPIDFGHHFIGKVGVGAVPILDTNDCHWAVIDIDNHGEEEDTPIAPIDQIVIERSLPLVVCRSKSGGIHAYIFFSDPQPAVRVRNLLKDYASIIGYPDAEIYPKQNTIKVGRETGRRQLGNGVNLPYFYLGDTNRYAYRNNKKLDINEFIALAHKLRLSNAEFSQLILRDHVDAPPCIQRMFTEGVQAGSRNEAAFHIGVYLRKAYPESAEAKLREINNVVFSSPLPRQELLRTIASSKNPDYGYRCSIDPQHSLCDRPTCLTRKYGVTVSEAEVADAYAKIPEFTDLVKIMSDPVRWEMKIDGKMVCGISTSQLLEWRFMREVIADKLTRIVPMVKNGEWERILNKAMEEVRIIDAPDDASINGVIRNRLKDFAARADLMSHGTDPADRMALTRGLPCVQVYDGERVVMFRSQDFVQYLKRTRSEELKGVGLWLAVRDIGVRHTKIRVGEHSVNVWMFPVDELQQEMSEATAIEFNSEI